MATGREQEALLDREPAWVNAEIVPTAVRSLESQAMLRQRNATWVQAGYLALLVVAPAAALVSELVTGGASAAGNRVAAAALAAALGMKLLLRWRAPDASRVRARRDVEVAKALAWRRCLARGTLPDDSPLCRTVGEADLATRWAFYRRCRVDDQIAYFRRRGTLHSRVARRWRIAQTVLTVLAVPAVAAQVAGWQSALVGLVVTLLATSEAWLQFRRSDFLAVSFAEAAAELETLRSTTPADDAELVRVVDKTERLLEQERWTWVALSSLTVLTAAKLRAGPAS